MSYKTLMVRLELDGDNAGVLVIAAELAARFDAKVIGIAACQPVQVMAAEGIANIAIEEEYAQIAREIAAAEGQFRSALAGRVKVLEWRSTITYAPLAEYIAEQARAADLIITGKDLGFTMLDGTRRLHVGDLAMRAGRPVFLVPQGVRTLPLHHVFVGWKESREARRAASDALPLLRAAKDVTVMEVTSEGRRLLTQPILADVTDWLARQGVTAAPQVAIAMGSETGFLRALLLDRKCDLFVAGAYGRNRLSEWVFGGVTQDILLDPDCCVLISH
jgi:nucleotide-binding universal stress UspA family protein